MNTTHTDRTLEFVPLPTDPATVIIVIPDTVEDLCPRPAKARTVKRTRPEVVKRPDRILESRHWETSDYLFFGTLVTLFTATLVIVGSLVSALWPLLRAVYAVAVALSAVGPLAVISSLMLLAVAIRWRPEMRGAPVCTSAKSSVSAPAPVRTKTKASVRTRVATPAKVKSTVAAPAPTSTRAREVAHLVGSDGSACGVRVPFASRNAHPNDPKCPDCVAADNPGRCCPTWPCCDHG